MERNAMESGAVKFLGEVAIKSAPVDMPPEHQNCKVSAALSAHVVVDNEVAADIAVVAISAIRKIKTKTRFVISLHRNGFDAGTISALAKKLQNKIIPERRVRYIIKKLDANFPVANVVMIPASTSAAIIALLNNKNNSINIPPADVAVLSGKTESAPVAEVAAKIKTPKAARFNFATQDTVWAALMKTKDSNLPILIKGDTGLGKTRLVLDFCKSIGKSVVSWNMNGHTDIDDILGHWIILKGETVWVDGVVINAMRTGKALLLDEINAVDAEILFVLHSLLDDRREIMLADHNEVVKAHPDFRLFATCNMGYLGTKDYNTALLSRFAMTFILKTPTQEEEQRFLVHETKIAADEAEAIVKVLGDMRKSGIDMPLGLRESAGWARLLERFSVAEAFDFAVGNKTEADLTAYKNLLWEKN